jgi:2-polyprenyl-6-methoxyphenol hydroxylase-like FAD-dependent oxidoreductase
MSVEERVAVVGAGPVGLLSALGLAQAGIPVIVIERASEIVASPRAITYHWSVLEGLDRLGLLEEALDVGFAKQDYSYLDFATGEKINYSLDVLDGRTSSSSLPWRPRRAFRWHLAGNGAAGCEDRRVFRCDRDDRALAPVAA